MKDSILANIETSCLFLLMQPVITHQYQHTYKLINSEKSNDNEIQEEILKISKNKNLKFFTVFQLNHVSRHNDIYIFSKSAKNKTHK